MRSEGREERRNEVKAVAGKEGTLYSMRRLQLAQIKFSSPTLFNGIICSNLGNIMQWMIDVLTSEYQLRNNNSPNGVFMRRFHGFDQVIRCPKTDEGYLHPLLGVGDCLCLLPK